MVKDKQTGDVNKPSQGSKSDKEVTKTGMARSEPLKAVYGEWAERFEKLLRMSEYPLAAKMAEKDEDIPNSAKRPPQGFWVSLKYMPVFCNVAPNGADDCPEARRRVVL